jgi:outer membrane protein TolC
VIFPLRPLLFALPALAMLGSMAVHAKDNVPGLPHPGQGEPATRWTSDQVVRIALANHPLVGQADATSRSAEARKGQAEAAHYPSVSLTAAYLRTRTFSAVTGNPITSTIDSIQGNAGLLVTDFGRTTAAVAKADAQSVAARETGKSVRQDVAFAAKVAYYGVLRARRILEVDRETARRRESLLVQARAYYEAGIRARIDVARAEANLFQARADLTSAENDLRVARITLLNRMGIDGPGDFELAETLDVESLPGSLDEWTAEAERNRPDLRSLLSNQRAEEEAVRVARGGHFPTLTGTAGYGYAADDFPLEEVYNIGIQLSVPIFSGFLVRQQVAEAEGRLSSARYAVADFRRLVRLQVEQAALSLRESTERAEARRKEREASEENLRLATARYEVGAGDIIEMIDAQVQMTQADTALINALTDTKISVAALLRAIGR